MTTALRRVLSRRTKLGVDLKQSDIFDPDPIYMVGYEALLYCAA